MNHTSAFVLISALFLVSCSTEKEPNLPEYDPPIVIENEPRLSANAQVVDVTGDGLNDVILAIGRHWPGPNLLFTGMGNGKFSSVDTLSSPYDRSYSVSAIDMDLDGDIDLVVSNDRPDPKYIMLNDGNGNFSQRIEFGDPTWPTRNITVSDLNQDGLPDIVVANRSNAANGNNWICLNESKKALSLNCQPFNSSSSTTISVADINSDGYQDLIIPFRDVGQSHVYLGDGTGSFTNRIQFGPKDASFRAAVSVHMNNDDLVDIVAIDDQKKMTTVFYQVEPNQFDNGHRVDSGDVVPYALYAADLDSNGRGDLIVGYRGAPTRIFFNRIDGIIESAIGDSLGATYGFGVGDVNHDGTLDIVSARSGAPDLLFLGRISVD